MRLELNSASTTTQAAAPDQERLARILDEYLVAIEQGKSVSPDDLLAKYPDDAAQLRGYLSGLQLFHAAAAPHPGSGTLGEVGVPTGLQSIGDYRLVREIGRGGMGVVYEAWQVSLRRRVALKVLPFTSAHDVKQISRFKNEAQAAAQAQHPNIVPVFAIGEEAGTHYYVMQLIEGQSLTSLLAALRNGGTPRCGTTAPNFGDTYDDGHPALTGESSSSSSTETTSPMRASETADHIRAVARLGIQAAEALHAAHEIGIVHRDVKPSNLLLDDQGKLWITDFGLARCRENPGLTQTGDILGTMRYTSPEQALGRTALVDERSDLYSLGLTLYELATLNHPADEISDVQLLFDRNRPPVKPLRHWNRNIPRDFETIVLKCMSEFPHERYNTARDLADDLARFLDGRPIVASPPSMLSRVGKWAKRRRGVVYAAAAVLVLAACGLVANNVLLSRETAAKDTALIHAKESLRDFGRSVDVIWMKYADQLDGVPGADSVRESMVNDCIQLYRKFERQAIDDPSLAPDMATSYGQLSKMYDKLGNRTAAMENADKAHRIWQDQVKREPANREYMRNLALCENNLGLLIAGDGPSAEGLELLRKASETQAALQADNPNWSEIADDLAATHNNIGLLLSRTDAKVEAVKEFQAAIAINQTRAKSDDSDETAIRTLAATYNNLASVNEATDPKAAASAYQKAIENQRSLMERFPTNRIYQSDIARTYNNLGYLSSRNKDWSGAESCFANAIRVQENLVKGSPLSHSYRRELAVSCNNLGMAQSRANRLTEADVSFQKAAKLQDVLLKAHPSDVSILSNQGSVWNNLGMLYDRQKRLPEAATAYEQAIEFQRRALDGSQSSDAIRVLLGKHYFNYARNLAAQARYNDAVAVELERSKLSPGNADRLYSVALDLAAIYRLMNGKPGAEQQKAKCVEAAASTLREALAAGLSRDKLQDRLLSGLTQDAEFVKLMDAKTNELSQTN